VPDPQAYLGVYARQLAALERHIALSERVVDQQLREPDVLPITRARCDAVLAAARGQLADIRGVLQPMLDAVAPEAGHDISERQSPPPGLRDVGGGGAEPADAAAAGDDLPSVLTNVHYLFRDWGWPAEAGGENERALAAVDRVLAGEPTDRTLVLGAGACRLAYDLHGRSDSTETVVIDLDALLFAVAHAVIRGGTIAIRESYVEVNEIGHAEKRWQLAVPRAAVGDERFHFVLADGLEPPFADGRFDSVITPWFVDVASADMRDVISVAHRVLRPGGTWVNIGALRYTPGVPVARRYSREEIFDLAARAGFEIGPWTTESGPSLVSRHTGRGKVEWTMTFAARKLDGDPAAPADRPPSWLLFRHLPIDMFSGQSLVYSPDPLAQFVAGAIDGRRSLDDLTRLVAARTQSSRLSRNQIREAVRRCLAEIHPACRT
jgi:SAM-dependent methyltransferase